MSNEVAEGGAVSETGDDLLCKVRRERRARALKWAAKRFMIIENDDGSRCAWLVPDEIVAVADCGEISAILLRGGAEVMCDAQAVSVLAQMMDYLDGR